jgi:tetratricopeptide (TPR) repeat protein
VRFAQNSIFVVLNMVDVQKTLNEAFKLYDQKRYAEALVQFDIVERTNRYESIYYERGCCLQSLDYHLDAIDDFTKAIELSPGEANIYFMRSMSYLQLGDVVEAWKDNITAIQLSKNNNNENSEANKRAKEMGYETATSFYELRLDFVKLRADMSEITRKHLDKPRVRRSK